MRGEIIPDIRRHEVLPPLWYNFPGDLLIIQKNSYLKKNEEVDYDITLHPFLHYSREHPQSSRVLYGQRGNEYPFLFPNLSQRIRCIRDTALGTNSTMSVLTQPRILSPNMHPGPSLALLSEASIKATFSVKEKKLEMICASSDSASEITTSWSVP